MLHYDTAKMTPNAIQSSNRFPNVLLKSTSCPASLSTHSLTNTFQPLGIEMNATLSILSSARDTIDLLILMIKFFLCRYGELFKSSSDITQLTQIGIDILFHLIILSIGLKHI